MGGNAWSEIDSDTGIEIHKYGSHLFHTSNQKVWEFVRKFTQFREYRHTVFANVKDEIHSLPINLSTLNSFFKRDFTPLEAAKFFDSASQITIDPKNFEEKVISKIGSELYEAFYLGYTKKQWGTDPKLLPIEMASRLPIRTTRNNRYFKDKFEGLPFESYGKFLTNMGTSQNIDFLLSTDYQEVKASIKPSTFIVYTGPIDQYFKYSDGRLGWRTLDFETTTLDMRDFQGTAVMNYPDIEIPSRRVFTIPRPLFQRNSLVSLRLVTNLFTQLILLQIG
jgi:UDP-galactopyranose mutase